MQTSYPNMRVFPEFPRKVNRLHHYQHFSGSTFGASIFLIPQPNGNGGAWLYNISSCWCLNPHWIPHLSIFSDKTPSPSSVLSFTKSSMVSSKDAGLNPAHPPAMTQRRSPFLRRIRIGQGLEDFPQRTLANKGNAFWVALGNWC